MHLHLQNGNARAERVWQEKAENCVFVLGDPVLFFFTSVRSVASLSPHTWCRSSGWVPSCSQDCSRQDLILQGSRDTMCACVCVSLPGLYPDIIIKGHICGTEVFFCCFFFSFFFSGMRGSILFNIITQT